MRLLVGMCSWNNPKLLKCSIPSILRGIDRSKDGICVVLNEGDKESMEYLISLSIPFVYHPRNEGVLAIDYLKPFIQHYDYFLNTNDDMLFCKSFSDDLINIINTHYPATASCKLIENFQSYNPCVIVDSSIKSIYNLSPEEFDLKCAQYRTNNIINIISYNHPICCLSSDFLKIGGYSGNWKAGYSNGYARDDAFPNELLKLNDKYRFIQSGSSFVFHQSSETMKKLPPEIRNRDNQDTFIQDYGMSISQFKSKIRCFSPL